MCLQVLTLSMEEVVTATGAGAGNFKALALSSVVAGHDQQQPSAPPGSLPGIASDQATELVKDRSPKQALPIPAASLPLPDEESHCSTAVDDVPNFGDTLGLSATIQTYPKSSRSRLGSMQISRRHVLENSISVVVDQDGELDSLADTSGRQLPLSFSGYSESGTGLIHSSKGRSELPGEFHRQFRRAARQGTKCRRGNMAVLRRHGLARAVRGEVEKAAVSEAIAGSPSNLGLVISMLSLTCTKFMLESLTQPPLVLSRNAGEEVLALLVE